MAEGLDVEAAVDGAEVHEVQRRQVAGRVVEEHVLGAGVGGVDARRVRAGVPGVDGGVELQARVAAQPGRLGDLPHELAGPDASRAARPSVRAVSGHSRVVHHRAHEVVGDADRVVGVLEEDRVVGAAVDVEAAVVAGVDERPGLLLLARPCSATNSTMSGWSALRITILAARRVLPPDLMTPAKASKPRMKETGPEASPPPESMLLGGADAGEVGAGARAVLEEHALGLGQLRMESIESSTELMKQAEHCGCSSTPTLNQTGELKLIFCR